MALGRGYCIAACVGVLAWTTALPVRAGQDDDRARERGIKAAYVYNFALYVQWPKADEREGKFHIGIVGEPALRPFLDKIAASKTIEKKPIVIHHFTAVKDYQPCHILFVAAEAAQGTKESAEERLNSALATVKGKAVLVVTEFNGAANKGAAINFFIEENRVKFEINPTAAKAAGLKISSKVLQLGKIVTAKK